MHNNTSHTILVVDDDLEVRNALSKYLSDEGFIVDSAVSGREMIKLLDRDIIDLIVLDLVLKNESGLDLLKTVVANSDIPVIILTGKSDPIERVVGLELGADDYIVKPFLQREVLARINAVLRRTSKKATSTKSSTAAPKKMQVNNWLLDLQTRNVHTDGNEQVKLTAVEFDILVALANNVGVAITRDELCILALNREWDPNDRSIDIHIHNLRRKLAKGECLDHAIVAVRNVGYLLAANVTQH